MKVIFLFNFLRLSKEEETVEKKQWSKQSNLATSREDIRETHSILAYCFTELLFLSTCVVSPQCRLPRVFQVWLILPNRKCWWRSIEYNSNWYWLSVSSKIRSKRQEHRRQSSAAWEYSWLACVYQTLSTSSPPLTSMRVPDLVNPLPPPPYYSPGLVR